MSERSEDPTAMPEPLRKYLEKKSKEDSKDPGRAYFDLYRELDRMFIFTLDAPYRPNELDELNLMKDVFTLYEKLGEATIKFDGEVCTMKQAMFKLMKKDNDIRKRDQNSSNDELH